MVKRAELLRAFAQAEWISQETYRRFAIDEIKRRYKDALLEQDSEVLNVLIEHLWNILNSDRMDARITGARILRVIMELNSEDSRDILDCKNCRNGLINETMLDWNVS